MPRRGEGHTVCIYHIRAHTTSPRKKNPVPARTLTDDSRVDKDVLLRKEDPQVVVERVAVVGQPTKEEQHVTLDAEALRDKRRASKFTRLDEQLRRPSE